MITTLSLVDFAMPPQIRDDREVTATAVNLTSKCCAEVSEIAQSEEGCRTYAFRQCGCTYVSGESWGG